MALNAPRGWLITYDITDPKRLVRLHRFLVKQATPCLLYTSPSPRDRTRSRMPSSA